MAFLAAIKKRTDLRVKGVAKESDDRDPTTVTDTPWIGELDPKRFAELASGGKWMQFYDHNKIWPHWQKCQQLYRANKLKGVSNMKVSTMHPHHSSGIGVIILYCGPPDNQHKVKEIGRNILIETGYTNLSKKMFYKTDTQTLSKGKSGYHKFELLIPRENFDKLKMEPINTAIPSKMKNISSDEYKQQNNNNNNRPYTQQYLQNLSKSQLIDIVMQLQDNTANTNRKKQKYSKTIAPITRAPMAPMAPTTVPMRAPLPNQAPIPAPMPRAPMAPMAPRRVLMRAPLPNQAPIPGAPPIAPPMRAPIPAPIPKGSSISPAIPPTKNKNKNKRKNTKSIYDKYLKVIQRMGFERVVIIKRDNLEMLSSTNKHLDSKEKWKQRIEQQSVLNGRQKLVVLNWFRKQILLKENIFKFQSNWDFPSYILNIIVLHYLENIDDKQQLTDDWCDDYKPCFYFYQQKWNILLRDGDIKDHEKGYQSLVCLKGKECLIAKQCKTIWIISKVRIMSKQQLSHRYQWMSYRFSSAPQAYNKLHTEIFEQLQDLDI